MAKFVPERPVAVAGSDAEVAADIDDDSADRAATHLGGDSFLGGQARQTSVLGGVGRQGVGWRDLPWGAWPVECGWAERGWCQVPAACGAPAKPGFQGRGAEQARGDAGEDDREIGGGEGSGEKGTAWGADTLLNCGGELLAVIDQFAQDAEDATDAGRHARVGPGRIGGHGWDGSLGRGGHEQK